METKSLDNTDDSPASLALLPRELLTKIMSFAMASDMPVFLWLFRNLIRINRFYDSLLERAITKPFLTDPELPETQQQHLQDWVTVTGTCRRLREYGIPAFFRERSFVVPPHMLKDLLDGKIRSSNFDMAIDCIHKVEVPVGSVSRGASWMFLPKYHRFTRLSTLTIRVPDSRDQILDEGRRERPWSQETPRELHDLLRRLGLRVDITQLQLVVMAKEESKVPELIQIMKQKLYPLLRARIQRRANPVVTPI